MPHASHPGPAVQGWRRWLAWLIGRRPAPAFTLAEAGVGTVVAPPVGRPAPAAAPEPDVRETAPPAAAITAPAAAAATAPPEESPQRQANLESLHRLQQIPALQSLAQGFVRAATRSDGSVDDVVDAVRKDPSLCVRVLRMANSAAISPARKIDDIATAVQMLGLRRVGTLAHVLFTMRDSGTMAGGLNWRHLWIHSLATASLAEELGHRLGTAAGPQLYLAALLHDVGKIALSTVLPEQYQAIVATVLRDGARLDRLEREHLGVSHGEAGVIFAHQARLPEEVVAAIAWHNEPQRAESHHATVGLVSLANYVSKLHGLGFGGSLLTEQDGEWENQPAWSLPGLCELPEDERSAIAEEMRTRAGEIKLEMFELQHAA